MSVTHGHSFSDVPTLREHLRKTHGYIFGVPELELGYTDLLKIHNSYSDLHDNTDTVDHPKYYNSHPSGIECIDVVEHMTFNLGNTVKYLWRSGLKDSSPELEDLKKARWYIDREIQRLEKEK